MQKHYSYITIDLDKKIYTKLKAVQGDSKSRCILANLIDNNVCYDLSGTSVKVYGVKKDKTIFFNDATIVDAAKGQFEIELTNQALAVAGDLKIQILILGHNQEKLSTFSFFIEVAESIIDDEAIESSNEFTTLITSLSKLEEWNSYFEETSGKIEEKYTERLNELGEQFNTKANKNITKNSTTLQKNVSDLNFSTVSVSRQVNLMSDFVYNDDDFNGDYGFYDEVSVGASGITTSKTTANGIFTYTCDNWISYMRKTKKFNTIPFNFMELGVESFGTQTTGIQSVGVGLIKDTGNYLMVIYDSINKQLKVDINFKGETVSRCVTDITLTTPCKIGFCQNENSISMFVDEGGGWRYINHAGSYKTVLDLSNPINMKDWCHGYAIFTNKPNTIKLNSFKTGAFGQVGVRDQNLVRYTDGTPLIINNEVYLTATSGGVRNSIPGSHWSVFSMNLSTYEIKERSKILIKRDGLILGDHAGNIVFDEEENCFHVFVSNWGDWTNVGPAKILYGKYYSDLLSGINILDNVTALNLPLSSSENSAYDPDVVKYNGEWHIFFTESSKTADSNSFSAHVKGIDLNNLTRVAGDTAGLSGSYEGCKVQKIGGTWYVFSSNLTAYRCCKADDMSFVVNVNAPLIGNNSAKPHFTIIPVPEGNKTKLIVVSFDNTQYNNIGIHTRGNWFVFENDRLLDGYEFQAIKIPNLL